MINLEWIMTNCKRVPMRRPWVDLCFSIGKGPSQPFEILATLHDCEDTFDLSDDGRRERITLSSRTNELAPQATRQADSSANYYRSELGN